MHENDAYSIWLYYNCIQALRYMHHFHTILSTPYTLCIIFLQLYDNCFHAIRYMHNCYTIVFKLFKCHKLYASFSYNCITIISTPYTVCIIFKQLYYNFSTPYAVYIILIQLYYNCFHAILSLYHFHTTVLQLFHTLFYNCI